MQKSPHTTGLLILAVVAGAAGAVFPSVARAASTAPRAETVGHEINHALDQHAATGVRVRLGGHPRVIFPTRASNVTRISAGNTSISLRLPTEGAGTRFGALRVYGGRSDAPLAVQRVNGGIRAIIDIRNAASPHRYRFSLGGGVAAIRSNADGGLVLVDHIGREVGTIDAPWARDATGRPVATRFEFHGTTVVQTVQFGTDTTFPVVADPAVHVHWTTFTIELYPLDQQALKNGSLAAASAVGAFVCAELGAAALLCGGGAAVTFAILHTYVDKYFHPHCHLNLSFHYYGPFDRWWTSHCT